MSTSLLCENGILLYELLYTVLNRPGRMKSDLNVVSHVVDFKRHSGYRCHSESSRFRSSFSTWIWSWGEFIFSSFVRNVIIFVTTGTKCEHRFMENMAIDYWWFDDDFCHANCESLSSFLMPSWSSWQWAQIFWRLCDSNNASWEPLGKEIKLHL